MYSGVVNNVHRFFASLSNDNGRKVLRAGMMEISQKDGARYQDAWNDYKRRRNFFLFVFLGYVPWGALVLFTMNKLGLPQGVVWIGAWFVMYPVAAIRFSLWRCPRCGNPFYQKWWYHNGFARKCVHCGLARKEIKAAAQGGNY